MATAPYNKNRRQAQLQLDRRVAGYGDAYSTRQATDLLRRGVIPIPDTIAPRSITRTPDFIPPPSTMPLPDTIAPRSITRTPDFIPPPSTMPLPDTIATMRATRASVIPPGVPPGLGASIPRAGIPQRFKPGTGIPTQRAPELGRRARDRTGRRARRR